MGGGVCLAPAVGRGGGGGHDGRDLLGRRRVVRAGVVRGRLHRGGRRHRGRRLRCQRDQDRRAREALPRGADERADQDAERQQPHDRDRDHARARQVEAIQPAGLIVAAGRGRRCGAPLPLPEPQPRARPAGQRYPGAAPPSGRAARRPPAAAGPVVHHSARSNAGRAPSRRRTLCRPGCCSTHPFDGGSHQRSSLTSRVSPDVKKRMSQGSNQFFTVTAPTRLILTRKLARGRRHLTVRTNTHLAPYGDDHPHD